ncbi:MAG: helix-turn-helix transcriptional regulator [Clostridia bacterium]|nr:helix-turn-helix transcriptional regulator [Clostridia bacterium]
MFKDNLKSLRILNNLTQQALAEKLGVSFKTISHWESGYSEPSLQLLVELKNVLDTTFDELLE